MAHLHVVTRGDPSAPAIVFVHAMGSDHRFWDEAVVELSRDFFCVTPDLQGAGETPLPAEPVDADGHAADLAEMIEALDLGQVTLAGCAIGGMVAAILAASEPALCSGLVMTNPGLRNLPHVKDMLRARTEEVRRHGMAVLMPKAPETSFHEMPRDARYARFAERYAAQSAEGYALSVLGFLDIDIRPILPGLTCPVMLMPGGKDVLMPPEGAQEIADQVPQAEIVPVPEAAHFVPYQAPERFVSEMRRFLRETTA